MIKSLPDSSKILKSVMGFADGKEMTLESILGGSGGDFIGSIQSLIGEKSSNVLDLVNSLLPQQFKDLFNIFDKPEQTTNESCECKILKEILATLKGQSTPAQINKQAAVAATAVAEKTATSKPTSVGTLDGGVAADQKTLGLNQTEAQNTSALSKTTEQQKAIEDKKKADKAFADQYIKENPEYATTADEIAGGKSSLEAKSARGEKLSELQQFELDEGRRNEYSRRRNNGERDLDYDQMVYARQQRALEYENPQSTITKPSVIQAPPAPGTNIQSETKAMAEILSSSSDFSQTNVPSKKDLARSNAMLESKRNKSYYSGQKLSRGKISLGRGEITQKEYDELEKNHTNNRQQYTSTRDQYEKTAGIYDQRQAKRNAAGTKIDYINKSTAYTQMDKNDPEASRKKAEYQLSRDKYEKANGISEERQAKREAAKLKVDYLNKRTSYTNASNKDPEYAAKKQAYLDSKNKFQEITEKSPSNKDGLLSQATTKAKELAKAIEKQTEYVQKQSDQPVPSPLTEIRRGTLDGGVAGDQAATGTGPNGQGMMSTVITVDSSAKDLLEGLKTTFSNFNSYIDKLAAVASTIPSEINLVGKYDLNINITGAAAFETLSKEMRNVAEALVKPQLDKLRDEVSQATKGAVKSTSSMGYRGDVNSSQSQGQV